MEDYERAEPLYCEVLESTRRLFGDDNIEIITDHTNLDFIYIDMGRYDEAENLTRKALDKSESIQGYEHSTMLEKRNHLVLVFERKKIYQEAEKLWREVLHSKERPFESNSPRIAFSICHLAQNYVHQGRLEEALPLHEKALQIRTSLGDDHYQNLESMAYVSFMMSTTQIAGGRGIASHCATRTNRGAWL
ncbi:hypothetical protein EJ02DRAFT_489521 [Clathrospora elynae]|uniref:Uncharacterized protein n=1 Tax=Clathrospora elynae TaxID=706981 RepID=A0A6A5T4F3_9PLEO|nr:hypothetical protein EJ02DRAFT_489521 [Clathrospora elynae]